MDDPRQLAELVRRTPALYDERAPGYGDARRSRQLWNQLGAQLCDRWPGMDHAQRINYVNDVRKRWRSMRDSFVKDYKRLKKSNGSRKKRYQYFDELSFLIPSCENKGIPGVSSGSGTVHPVRPVSPTQDGEDLKTETSQSENIAEPSRDCDEDKLFLLSLLPTFRRLDAHHKLTAKIQIMQTLHQFLHAKDLKNPEI